MAASGRIPAPRATAAPSACTVTKGLLPRSERLGGRNVDAATQSRDRIGASLRQHPSRSSACLTTLHEPCPAAEVPTKLRPFFWQIPVIGCSGNSQSPAHLRNRHVVVLSKCPYLLDLVG